MKISGVDIYTYDIKHEAYSHFTALVDTLKEVFIKITADNGLTGFGEARANFQYVLGQNQEGMINVLQNELAPAIIGEDPFEINMLINKMDKAIVSNSGAKSAIDLALFDLIGKALNSPLYKLIGGNSGKKSVPTNHSIGFGTPQEAKEQALQLVEKGFYLLKIRVGMGKPSLDIERVKIVRDAVGDEVLLAVDVNQGWSPGKAISILKKMEKYDLEYAEQPVPAENIFGLARVRKSVNIPIMADESIHSPEDAFNLIRHDAVDLFHLKQIKAGGIFKTRKIIGLAEAAGISYMQGHTSEGRLATSAAVHLAVSSNPQHFELGFDRVIDDPTSGLEIIQGSVLVPKEPGLGVNINEQKLHHRITIIG